MAIKRFCDFCEEELHEDFERPVKFNTQQVDLCNKCWMHLHDFISNRGDISKMKGGKDETKDTG